MPKMKIRNFQMKLHQKEVRKTVRKDLSNTNIVQNRSVYKTTAIKLCKSKLCISTQTPVPARNLKSAF